MCDHYPIPSVQPLPDTKGSHEYKIMGFEFDYSDVYQTLTHIAG